MARPMKTGLDYYPMDVGFLRDKKVRLLQAEFGAHGVIFVLYVLGKVYEDKGYFLPWDKEQQMLTAADLQKPPTFVHEVLHGCLARSLFDERVFKTFGLLTSAGIQRRYLRGCEKREAITMISEYCLLDLADVKEVPAAIRAKLRLVNLAGENLPLVSAGNAVNSPVNPQSKEKKSKEKEIKEEERKTAANILPPPAKARLCFEGVEYEPDDEQGRHKFGKYGWVKLTMQEYSKLQMEMGETELTNCIAYIDNGVQKQGNLRQWDDWFQVLRQCNRLGWHRQKL